MRFWQCIIVVFLIILFNNANILFAQSTLLAPDISISTIPINPAPSEKVLVRAQSYSLDLDQSVLEWTYNGQLIDKGIGHTQISIVAPVSGQTGVLSLSVIGSGIASNTTTLILRPASVDILWEAIDAYTPPFYKGKALLPLNGAIKVTAIPSSSAPKGLVYKWTRNGSTLSTLSGYGKNSAVFKNETLNPEESIGLEISGGTYNGNGSTRIIPRPPTVIAYLKNEGFTNYANGFNDKIRATGNGTIVRFEPYYFSVPQSLLSNLLFEFLVNKTPVYGEQKLNELRFSRSNEGFMSNIDVSVSTAKYSLQNIQKKFTLTFQ